MATRTVDLGSVIGPQGPQGPRGAAGAAGARGPRGRGSARLVVGVSTAGWTADDCDYLCDGTADQVEINAAISALPADGGEIVILDGTYNITNEINVSKANVTLRGSGFGTKIRGTNTVHDWVYIRGDCDQVLNMRLEGCSLSLDGNYDMAQGVYMGPTTKGDGIAISGSYCVVMGNFARGAENAIFLEDSPNVVIGNVILGGAIYEDAAGNIVANNVT